MKQKDRTYFEGIDAESEKRVMLAADQVVAVKESRFLGGCCVMLRGGKWFRLQNNYDDVRKSIEVHGDRP